MVTKFANAQEAVAYVLGHSFQQPLGKAFEIKKSYRRPDGSLGIEGWISTPTRDIEKDVIEPESFAGDGFRDYMRRGAPVSIEHNTRSLPVGYLLKSRLVRDGSVIQDEDNPKHQSEDFRYFDGGTGWYGLGVVYNEDAIAGINKGVISSFSWIGMPVDWDNLADGGRRFSKKGSIKPVIEVTVTAYPVNTTATMQIAKARGYGYRIDRKKMVELLANPLVVDAVVDILVPPGTSAAVIEEELKRHRQRLYGAKD